MKKIKGITNEDRYVKKTNGGGTVFIGKTRKK
jgi:hypothetical protein